MDRKGKGNAVQELVICCRSFLAGHAFFSMDVHPISVLRFIGSAGKYPLEIGFHAEGVVLNSLFKKKFPWNSFQSVILKDGLLTLDFSNNKIFQKEVLDDEEPDAEEDEFNDYCRSKLVNL